MSNWRARPTKVAVVSPPWFDEQLAGLGTSYFLQQGFEVLHSASAALPSDQYAIGPAELVGWVRSHVPDRAEAVVIGGNGFRAVGVIDALEEALGRPVLTANQVLLWRLLGLAGSGAQVSGYGRLFAEPAPAD